MYSTVRVALETKEKLEALKEYKRESFDEVLNRLIDIAPKVKNELVSELVKDAEKYDKKAAKRYSAVSEFRKELEGR
ncbi:MAG: hypothetical protein AABW59_02275 [archaeon]